ncbi:MAG: hypothetical protein JWN67_4696 [Actinomycetia bacterium]|nr:hypothetical protein [Actinomycetes bacterium]
MTAVIVEPRAGHAVGDRLVALVEWLPLRLLSVLFALYVAGMGIGASQFEAGRLGSGQLDLDAEGRVFAVLSGLVLLSGAALAGLAVARRVVPTHVLVLGLLLAFMGLDEIATLHERLESATGVDWVMLYLPLMALGGLAALDLLRRRRDRAVTGPFLAGSACWAVAVVLEKLEWPHPEVAAQQVPAAHYVAMMIPEELLEITGSFLFALAIVLLIRRASRHHQAPRAASRQVAASS